MTPPVHGQRIINTFSSFLHGIHLLLDKLLERLQGTLGCENLNADTITDDLVILEESLEIRVDNFGESELPGHEHGLSSGELELCATEGLTSEGHLFGSSADGDEHWSDVDTSGLEKGLSVSVMRTTCQAWTLMRIWNDSLEV